MIELCTGCQEMCCSYKNKYDISVPFKELEDLKRKKEGTHF